jgi:Uma2 family endonuclease
MEILSPSNNKKELQNKYEVYEESGVPEYWIIHPYEKTLVGLYPYRQENMYLPNFLLWETECPLNASKALCWIWMNYSMVWNKSYV